MFENIRVFYVTYILEHNNTPSHFISHKKQKKNENLTLILNNCLQLFRCDVCVSFRLQIIASDKCICMEWTEQSIWFDVDIAFKFSCAFK